MHKYIKTNEIDSKYVGSDCVQLMIPFNKSLSIIGENDLMFYCRGIEEQKIDNSHYIEDERRKQFPYNNIPLHITRKNLYSKSLYINQLFDFNKPYIFIRDGNLSEGYVVNKNNKTYFIQTYFSIDKKDATLKTYIEQNKIYDYFQDLINNNDGKKTYIIDSTGKHLDLCFDKKERNEKRKKLIEILKQKNLLGYCDEHNIYYGDCFDIEDNFMLPVNKPMFIIKLNDDQIQIKLITLSSYCDEIVKLVSFDIPVEKYNFEQIKQILTTETPKLKEPRFSKIYRKK